MAKSRFVEEAQNFTIGSFRRLVQANIETFIDRDGTEQQVPAHRGGKLAIPVQADGMIRTPDFASARMFQEWQIKVNDGAWKRHGQTGSEGHDRQGGGTRCGQPSAQIGLFHIRDFDLARGIENTLARGSWRSGVRSSYAHS